MCHSSRLKYFVSYVLCLIALIWISGDPVWAEADWINSFIKSHGGCPALEDGVGVDMPYAGYQLGKKEQQWTDADLQNLPQVFYNCERDLAGKNNSVLVRNAAANIDKLLVEIPKRVYAGRAEQRRQDTLRSDNHLLAAGEIQRLAEIDRKEALKAADEAEARNKDTIAAAHARRDAAVAKRKTAELNAEAKEAQAEADRAEQAATQPPPKQSLPLIPPADNATASTPNVIFPFEVGTFKNSLNTALKNDGDSGLAECSTLGSMTACGFNQEKFQTSVSELKKLDMLNGNFKLKLLLKVNSLGTNVDKIVIQGDRGDPLNLFQYIGKVGSIVKVLEPNISDSEIQVLLRTKLGLMRGDDDDTIGEEKSDIRKAFVVSCNQSISSESTIMRCEFVPRS